MQMQHQEAPTAIESPPAFAGAEESAAETPRRLHPAPAAERQMPVTREMPKVGRNDLCPCGSGKKFKHCHGALV